MDDFGSDNINNEIGSKIKGNFVHIRIQQRSGRKTLTTIQGIGEEYDKHKIIKIFKKIHACNGVVINHAEYGEVLQLQGDQRQNMYNFLVREEIVSKDLMKLHGF